MITIPIRSSTIVKPRDHVSNRRSFRVTQQGWLGVPTCWCAGCCAGDDAGRDRRRVYVKAPMPFDERPAAVSA